MKQSVLIGYVIFLFLFCFLMSAVIVCVFWRRNYERTYGKKMKIWATTLRIVILGFILFVGSAFLQMRFVFAA